MMWNYLQMIMDAGFELLCYDVKVYEELEEDEGYLSHIVENINVIFRMDGYNKDYFDNSYGMVLDDGEMMIFLVLYLKVSLTHQSLTGFHFPRED